MPTLKKSKSLTVKHINRAERQSVYNTQEWKLLRKSYFMKQPLCELCLQNGILKDGEDVHHIISPFKYKDKRKHYFAYNPDNLLTLCKDCHSNIHSNHKEESLYSIYYQRMSDKYSPIV